VSHLVGHVLTEAQSGRVDPNLDQELMNARHKIPECFICYGPRCHRITHTDLPGLRAAACLHVSVKEIENNLAYFIKTFVTLILRVDVMFNLCHGKFAHAEQPCAWGNFVPERTSDLGRREWNATVIELKETGEI
jgi:hypothetical protein